MLPVKRILIVTLTLILLLGGFYYWLRVSLGLFTPYNSWTANQDIKNGHIQVIAIGYPFKPLNRQYLARQYDFQYNYIGCNVTNELLNGSRRYNEVVDTYLTNKFGINFWHLFQRQLDSINSATSKSDEHIEDMINLVSNQSLVQRKVNLIDSLSKHERHIVFIPVLYNPFQKIYLIKVCEDNGSSLVTYFNFLVRADSMKILNMDGELDSE